MIREASAGTSFVTTGRLTIHTCLWETTANIHTRRRLRTYTNQMLIYMPNFTCLVISCKTSCLTVLLHTARVFKYFKFLGNSHLILMACQKRQWGKLFGRRIFCRNLKILPDLESQIFKFLEKLS